MGTVVALVAVLALLAWFLWPSPDPRPPARRTEVDDQAELEQAEREVQEAPDAETVRDWGPGASKPPS
jgi:beta-lactam-binding protein with PASTA domain